MSGSGLEAHENVPLSSLPSCSLYLSTRNNLVQMSGSSEAMMRQCGERGVFSILECDCGFLPQSILPYWICFLVSTCGPCDAPATPECTPTLSSWCWDKLKPVWNQSKNHRTKNNVWHYRSARCSLPLLGLSAVGDMLFHHPRLIVMIGSGICLNSHPPRAHWGNPAGGERQWAESPSFHVS